MADNEFEGGAVRSADVGHLSFTSLPLVGLVAVARTAAEGAQKYGRLNYMLGMPVHDLLDHSLRHTVMFLLGDRSEPHLEHAAWGLLAAVQSYTLEPERSEDHLLGPGATVTAEVRAYLDKNRPELARRRAAGEFSQSGKWRTDQIPDVVRLLEQRDYCNHDTLDEKGQE